MSESISLISVEELAQRLNSGSVDALQLIDVREIYEKHHSGSLENGIASVPVLLFVPSI